MIRKLIRAEINTLADDEVEVIISTSALARDGHVLLPEGCQLENYRANPIVLWSHDPDKPVGNAVDIAIGSDKITARVKFAPAGISAQADETRGLVKADVIRAVSVGFDPIEGEPLDRSRPKGGQRFSVWDLLEFSFVSVPSDTGALVTARSNGDTDMATEPTEPTASAPAAAAPGQRMSRAGGTRVAIIGAQRGLYQVASLCYMFEQLGYQVDSAKYEAAIEGDGSKVPGMLASVLHELGDALLAMTQEEIAEALAGCDVEPEEDADDEILIVDDRAHIRAASTPRMRAFRRGLAHAKVRAGKSLSTETVRSLREAKALHEEAVTLTRSAMRKHKDGLDAIDDLMTRAGVADTDEIDTGTGQKLDGGQVDEGSRANSDYRRRQAELLSFTAS